MRTPKPEYLDPGTVAPTTGKYVEHNVFRSRTGMSVKAHQGNLLPSLPRGHTWRLARSSEPISPIPEYSAAHPQNLFNRAKLSVGNCRIGPALDRAERLREDSSWVIGKALCQRER